MEFFLAAIIVLSALGSFSNGPTKYSSAIVFTISMLCTTALLIAGVIELN